MFHVVTRSACANSACGSSRAAARARATAGAGRDAHRCCLGARVAARRRGARRRQAALASARARMASLCGHCARRGSPRPPCHTAATRRRGEQPLSFSETCHRPGRRAMACRSGGRARNYCTYKWPTNLMTYSRRTRVSYRVSRPITGPALKVFNQPGVVDGGHKRHQVARSNLHERGRQTRAAKRQMASENSPCPCLVPSRHALLRVRSKCPWYATEGAQDRTGAPSRELSRGRCGRKRCTVAETVAPPRLRQAAGP